MRDLRGLTLSLWTVVMGGFGGLCYAKSDILGNGILTTDNRQGEPVRAVRVEDPRGLLAGDCYLVRVAVAEGAAAGVTVRAEKNVIKYVRTEVRDEVLHIWFSKKIRPTQAIVITGTRAGRASGAPPFEMEGLACSAGLTVRLPIRKSGSAPAQTQTNPMGRLDDYQARIISGDSAGIPGRTTNNP